MAFTMTSAKVAAPVQQVRAFKGLTKAVKVSAKVSNAAKATDMMVWTPFNNKCARAGARVVGRPIVASWACALGPTDCGGLAAAAGWPCARRSVGVPSASISARTAPRSPGAALHGPQRRVGRRSQPSFQPGRVCAAAARGALAALERSQVDRWHGPRA